MIKTECNRHYLWINSRHTVQRGIYLLIYKMQMVPPKMTHFSVSFNIIRTKLMCNTYMNHLQTILQHVAEIRNWKSRLVCVNMLQSYVGFQHSRCVVKSTRVQVLTDRILYWLGTQLSLLFPCQELGRPWTNNAVIRKTEELESVYWGNWPCTNKSFADAR